MTCEICFEVHPVEKMRAPACGHYFCETCWTGEQVPMYICRLATLKFTLFDLYRCDATVVVLTSGLLLYLWF